MTSNSNQIFLKETSQGDFKSCKEKKKPYNNNTLQKKVQLGNMQQLLKISNVRITKWKTWHLLII